MAKFIPNVINENDNKTPKTNHKNPEVSQSLMETIKGFLPTKKSLKKELDPSISQLRYKNMSTDKLNANDKERFENIVGNMAESLPMIEDLIQTDGFIDWEEFEQNHPHFSDMIKKFDETNDMKTYKSHYWLKQDEFDTYRMYADTKNSYHDATNMLSEKNTDTITLEQKVKERASETYLDNLRTRLVIEAEEMANLGSENTPKYIAHETATEKTQEDFSNTWINLKANKEYDLNTLPDALQPYVHDLQEKFDDLKQKNDERIENAEQTIIENRKTLTNLVTSTNKHRKYLSENAEQVGEIEEKKLQMDRIYSIALVDKLEEWADEHEEIRQFLEDMQKLQGENATNFLEVLPTGKMDDAIKTIFTYLEKDELLYPGREKTPQGKSTLKYDVTSEKKMNKFKLGMAGFSGLTTLYGLLQILPAKIADNTLPDRLYDACTTDDGTLNKPMVIGTSALIGAIVYYANKMHSDKIIDITKENKSTSLTSKNYLKNTLKKYIKKPVKGIALAALLGLSVYSNASFFSTLYYGGEKRTADKKKTEKVVGEVSNTFQEGVKEIKAIDIEATKKLQDALTDEASGGAASGRRGTGKFYYSKQKVINGTDAPTRFKDKVDEILKQAGWRGETHSNISESLQNTLKEILDQEKITYEGEEHKYEDIDELVGEVTGSIINPLNAVEVANVAALLGENTKEMGKSLTEAANTYNTDVTKITEILNEIEKIANSSAVTSIETIDPETIKELNKAISNKSQGAQSLIASIKPYLSVDKLGEFMDEQGESEMKKNISLAMVWTSALLTDLAMLLLVLTAGYKLLKRRPNDKKLQKILTDVTKNIKPRGTPAPFLTDQNTPGFIEKNIIPSEDLEKYYEYNNDENRLIQINDPTRTLQKKRHTNKIHNNIFTQFVEFFDTNNGKEFEKIIYDKDLSEIIQTEMNDALIPSNEKETNINDYRALYNETPNKDVLRKHFVNSYIKHSQTFRRMALENFNNHIGDSTT